MQKTIEDTSPTLLSIISQLVQSNGEPTKISLFLAQATQYNNNK